MYVVVDEGVAVTVPPVIADKPVDGVQVIVQSVQEAVREVDDPLQIVTSEDLVIVGPAPNPIS